MNKTDDRAYHEETMRGLGKHKSKLVSVFKHDGYEVLYYDSEGNWTRTERAIGTLKE